MAPCKAGKEKNSNGRCVKIKTQAACKGNKVRNEKGRCVTPRKKRCENGSRRNKSGNCVKRGLRGSRSRSRSRSRSDSRRWGDIPVRNASRPSSMKKNRPARGAKTQFAKDIQKRKAQIEQGHKQPINKLDKLKNTPESDQQGYGMLRWIE